MLTAGQLIVWHDRIATVLDVSPTGRYATILCTPTGGGQKFTAHVNVENVVGFTTYADGSWPQDGLLCDVLTADNEVHVGLSYTHWDIWKVRKHLEFDRVVVAWRLAERPNSAV